MKIVIDGLNIYISKNNIHIQDSFKIKGIKEKKNILNKLLKNEPEILKYRTFNSLVREWRAHNILYKLNIKRSSTKDTDLEFHQKKIYSLGYFLVNIL